MWREWIEIFRIRFFTVTFGRLPPCGGSGLKSATGSGVPTAALSPSVWREWIEIYYTCIAKSCKTSPSVWREWIEIKTLELNDVLLQVSLRVEGVD